MSKNENEIVKGGTKPSTSTGAKQASLAQRISPITNTSTGIGIGTGQLENIVRQPYPLVAKNSFPVPPIQRPLSLNIQQIQQPLPLSIAQKTSRSFQHYDCPPAGSTPYPLSAAVTSTHPFYVNPPPIAQTHSLPSFVPFKGFVGQPGVKFGVQNEKLDDPLEVHEGSWTSPSAYLDGKATYQDEHERYYQERVGVAKSVEKGDGDQGDYEVDHEGEPTLGLRGGAATTKFRRKTKPRKNSGVSEVEEKGKRGKKATKRVKGKRIERAFIIGSEAWPLDETNTRKPDTPPEHTKGWRVYVKVPEGQPSITTWLKKVQFKIFHTYSNPTRMIEEPPFSITETGWGGFNVEVKLFFAPEVGSRAQDRTHFLQLEPYGGPEEEAKQRRELMVRSEVMDFIEFNEPTEALFDLLTDDSQFVGSTKAKGKGKKSMAMVKREGAEERSFDSVELPERSTAGNPYSKETEAALLKLLEGAVGKVDELIRVEDEKLAETRRKAKELRERAGVQA